MVLSHTQGQRGGYQRDRLLSHTSGHHFGTDGICANQSNGPMLFGRSNRHNDSGRLLEITFDLGPATQL